MIKNIIKNLHPSYQTLFLEYPVDFKPRHSAPNDPNPHLKKIVEKYHEDYWNLFDTVIENKDAFREIKYSSDQDIDLVWKNSFFPGLDIVVLYSLIKKYKPSKILEVGSGTSTLVMSKAIKENNLATKLISIDPQPRRHIDNLVDQSIRMPLEQTDTSVFAELDAGDILFIDNSHRAFPNSDVTVFFMEVLPLIKPGVLIHVHDIYIPFDYPQFMCDRFYNEQYLLATMLLSNPERYQIVSPNYYLYTMMKDESKFKTFWDFDEKGSIEQHGGSFWFTLF